MFFSHLANIKEEENPMNSTTVSKFNTLDQASSEFAAVVSDIAEELNKCIHKKLSKIKLVCLHLTNEQNVPILSEKEIQRLHTSKSIYDIFSILRPHWNWSNYHLLYIIIKRINAPKAYIMLEKFKSKVDYQMKLQYVFEHFRKNKRALPDGYYLMTAIINKDYSEITLEDGEKIETFVRDTLGVVQPCIDVSESQSIEMTWYIPDIAVENLCSKAFEHKDAFILQSFLFLKIANTVIFDKRQEHTPKVSTAVFVL